MSDRLLDLEIDQRDKRRRLDRLRQDLTASVDELEEAERELAEANARYQRAVMESADPLG